MADATPSGAPSSNRTVMLILSYLGLLALVPLLVEKDDQEVQRGPCPIPSLMGTVCI